MKNTLVRTNNGNRNELKRALKIAKKFLGNRSGDLGVTYYDRMKESVSLLKDLNADETTLIACAIYNVEDSELKGFGPEVMSIVESLRSLAGISTYLVGSDIEVLRRMFLVLSKDFRVVLIKLAERLALLKLIKNLQDPKYRDFLYESLELYVSLASRLGIYSFKRELEDICFRALHPRTFHNIKNQVEEYTRGKYDFIDEARDIVEGYLRENGMNVRVTSRIKNLYSIYLKLKKKGKTTVDELYDILAVRVILPNIFKKGEEFNGHLYSALSLMHKKWYPIEDRLKDYVVLPKFNGYRSIHTTVLGIGKEILDRPIEIQIRTEKMHKEAEFGLAAHWLYSDIKSEKARVFNVEIDSDKVSQIKQISSVARGSLAGSGSLDIYLDRVFVYTEDGVKELPKGSTPIDLAYGISTDCGHRCIGVKVNSEKVSLDYKLKTGDEVEILLGNETKPSNTWLSFVKTENAQSQLKQWFEALRVDYFETGKKKLNDYLVTKSKPLLDDSLSFLGVYNGNETNILFRREVVRRLGASDIELKDILKAVKKSKKKLVKKKKNSIEDSILIQGESGLSLKLTKCCCYGDVDLIGKDIVGYVTKGGSIAVHRMNCKLLPNLNPERFVEASWDSYPRPLQQRRFYLYTDDKKLSLSSITSILNEYGVSLIEFNLLNRTHSSSKRVVTLQYPDVSKLFFVISNLKRLPGIKSVELD